MRSAIQLSQKVLCCISAIFVFGVISCNPCSARLTQEQFAVGGIPLLAVRETVENIYGAPDEIKWSSARIVWYYGNSFTITFTTGRGVYGASKPSDPHYYGYYATDITTKANNGISTADNVSVGMDASVLNKTYGIPTWIDKRNGYDIYEYFGPDDGFRILFYINNGVIEKISSIIYI